MRLIDADNYCENICGCNCEECDKGQCPIHRVQTAYDVDKVVELLKEKYQENMKESQKYLLGGRSYYEARAEETLECIKIIEKGRLIE